MTTIPSPAPDPRTASGPAEASEVITERRREQVLLATDALQNAIFNSANFSSIATDAKGVIQIFNVGAERMLGYAAADVMNKITPADISDPSEVIARASALSVELGTPITAGFEALVYKASRGIEDIYELTYIRQDGSRFPAVVSVTALRDTQDAIIGYLLIGTDNTARKQAEAEKNKLQESSRMKSEFLANMSHELRTPLNRIIGFSEFLIDEKPGPLNPKQREFLGDIHSNGKHLLQLINDVLDLSKVEAGKMELTLETFSLARAIGEVCAVAKALAIKKRIHIKKDTGIGIRPEDFPRLFREFEQLDAGVARKYEGTGLGLALTSKIVELQHGHIAVVSAPGQGSTFTAFLPRNWKAGA